jgi:opacity protein-like surface antigen
MINKLFVFILALAITVNANATCSPWDPRCKPDTITGGFYGGATLGYTNLVGQLNRTLNVNTTDRVSSLGENGIVSGVFAGYEKIIDKCLYLAMEGFYQYADILIEKDENTFPGFVNYFTYIKNGHKGGIVGKVGFVHYNNIFYLKTGLALSRFVLGFKDNSGNHAITSNASRVQKGIILGGGMDYFINKNFAIGVEYDITCYPSMNFKSNTVGSFSFKPYSHTIQARFKYIL